MWSNFAPLLLFYPSLCLYRTLGSVFPAFAHPMRDCLWMLLSPVIEMNSTPSRQLPNVPLHYQEHGCILRGGIMWWKLHKTWTGSLPLLRLGFLNSLLISSFQHLPSCNFRSTNFKSDLIDCTSNLSKDEFLNFVHKELSEEEHIWYYLISVLLEAASFWCQSLSISVCITLKFIDW